MPSADSHTCRAAIEDARIFSDRESEWAHLLEQAPDANSYLSPNWPGAGGGGFGLPWRSSGGRSQPHVLTVRRGRQLVGLMPLISVTIGRGRLAFRMLVGAGQENADYGGALVAAGDGEAMEMLLDHLESELGRMRTVVNLTRLREDSWLLAALRRRFSTARYSLRCDFGEDYPFLDLASTPDPAQLVRRLLKKNDVLRRARRLGEHGAVEFRYHRPGHTGEDLRTFLELHDQRWEGRTATGVFASARGRQFLEDVAASLEAEGWLRLSFVTLDGKAIVGRFGTEFDGRYHGMKSGWDPSYSSYGPGHMVVGRILEEAVHRSLVEFDFMRGAGEHKQAWASDTRRIGYWTLGRSDRLSAFDRRALWTLMRLRNRARERSQPR